MERFFGGNPGLVMVRLAILSLVVGVLLAALGFSPFDILESIRELIVRIYDLGWTAVRKPAATSCSAPSSSSRCGSSRGCSRCWARHPRRSHRRQLAQPRSLVIDLVGGNGVANARFAHPTKS